MHFAVVYDTFSFLPQSSISVDKFKSLISERISHWLHLKMGMNSVTLFFNPANSLQSEYVTFFTPPASAIPAHSMLTTQSFIIKLPLFDHIVE